mmetsp:Transcript_25332/g.45682  ORF Transcript_25332/g.45682 Transcript_25332/m.45682 type:complete len:93 (-) Transcript_25332:3007-3285(-)
MLRGDTETLIFYLWYYTYVGQITVSAGIAPKKLPSLKLSCIPLTMAAFTAAGSSPGSNTTVMAEMTRRQFSPTAQPVSTSRMRLMVTGYSSV